MYYDNFIKKRGGITMECKIYPMSLLRNVPIEEALKILEGQIIQQLGIIRILAKDRKISQTSLVPMPKDVNSSDFLLVIFYEPD
jgi:hypothetical protein